MSTRSLYGSLYVTTQGLKLKVELLTIRSETPPTIYRIALARCGDSVGREEFYLILDTAAVCYVSRRLNVRLVCGVNSGN